MVKLQLNDDSLSHLTRKSQKLFFVVMQIHLEKYLIVGWYLEMRRILKHTFNKNIGILFHHVNFHDSIP